MAEDESDFQDENEEYEDVVGRRIIKEHKDNQKKKPCNSRIDQLAIPNRRFFLVLWQEHAYHFEKERTEKLKARLQELYAMTPEETEQYFAKLREEARKRAWRKMMKDKLKKLVAQKKRVQNRRKAYALFKKLLKKALKRAFNYESPVLVPVRLRLVSDIILEQLCDLRGLNVPDRTTSDKLGKFLIAVADWFALGVEYMYFVVQVKKNEELEEIERSARGEESIEKTEKEIDDITEFDPVIASTPRESFEFGTF